MIAQPSAVLRYPGALLGLRRAAVRSTSSLRRPAGAYSAARYENGVRALKFVAAALAGALAAMAFMKYEDGKQAATTLVPDGNETVIPRQAPPKTYARARLSEPAVVRPEADQSETSVAWNYPRAVRTVLFVNPSSGASTAAATRESAEPDAGFQLASATTRVGGFVAFSGKAAEQDPAELKFLAPRKGVAVLMEDVDQYLWEVYQRSPIKKDGSGDFTWKDPAAAKRVNMTLPDYVIGGMDPDFREQLYHAGRAMDAAGLKWTMLSAFRDDYRQRLASGFKARTGNSLHGGSRATGGYGHGRAVDLTLAEGNSEDVWDWLDDHGAKYGLYRPMPDNDPAHTQSRGDWRKLAQTLRTARVKETGLDKTKVVAAVTSKR
jgi:hypothetical protein